MRQVLWLVMVMVFVSFQAQVEAVVVINEVLADPAGDANGDGIVHSTQDEFVELANSGSSAVALDGWTLSDALQIRHNFDAAAVIPAFGLLVIFGGGSPAEWLNAMIASGGSLSLNNAGDTVTLRDAGGLPVDAFTFGSNGGQDTSLVRSPDATGAFLLHAAANGAAFSPGLTLDGRMSLPHPESEPELPPDREPGPPPLSTVPEPASLMLLASGASALLIRRRVVK